VANELTHLVRRGNRAVRSRAHRVLPELINEFHELVAVASGNEELIELLGQVRDKVRWMFEVDLPERSQDSWTDHALILEAILAGAAETAAQRMDVHVAKDELLYRDRFRMG
jgi:DNA-binding GntR family transcriptional regulator